MNASKILLLVAALTFTGCCDGPDCGVSHDDIVNFYEIDVKQFSDKVSKAFDNAEKAILGTDVPDDKPLGPDPDPSKCACGGSGKIRHGDGHTTPCPYHSGNHGESTTPKLEVDGKVLYYKGK